MLKRLTGRGEVLTASLPFSFLIAYVLSKETLMINGIGQPRGPVSPGKYQSVMDVFGPISISLSTNL